MLAFGQAAFMALPAYGAGILDNLGVPFALDVLVGIVGTLVIAWLMARVFVRLPGDLSCRWHPRLRLCRRGLARAFPSISGGASGLVFARGRAIGADLWYAIAVSALCVGLARLCRARARRVLAAAANDLP